MKTIRNIKRRLIAVFFAVIALFHWRNNSEALSLKKVVSALSSPFAVFSSCTNEPDDPPSVTLTRITADYTGTTAIYPTTPRDKLKDDLTVTAHYSDNTSKTLDSAVYTLSGELTVGENISITVTYEGKTAAFTVTVSASVTNPTLTGITAEYTGTAAVYPDTPLDNLKDGLTVTVNYSDNTSKTLDPADYTLSGELTVGENISITVTYEGKTAAFTVTVSTAPANQAPTAVAGVIGGTPVDDKYEFDFTLPDNRAIQLSGSGTDTDGTIASYTWACTDKPDEADTPAFDSTAQNPTVSGFDKLGDYEFTLTVKGNDGAESVGATVKVTLVRTASATVGIAAHSQTGGDTKLPFTPSYISNNTVDFPVENMSDYLTYTVTATGVNNASIPFTHTFVEGVDDFNGEVPYYEDFNGVWTTFTQTFYTKDETNLNKTRTLIALACTGSFLGFGGLENFSSDLNILGVTGISLSKKVTEGNIP